MYTEAFVTLLPFIKVLDFHSLYVNCEIKTNTSLAARPSLCIVASRYVLYGKATQPGTCGEGIANLAYE